MKSATLYKSLTSPKSNRSLLRMGNILGFCFIAAVLFFVLRFTLEHERLASTMSGCMTKVMKRDSDEGPLFYDEIDHINTPSFERFALLDAKDNDDRLVAFLAINTGPNAFSRRQLLRKTWFPSDLSGTEESLGLALRFVIGRTSDETLEDRLKEEEQEYNDILRLDVEDTYENLSAKTLQIFSELPHRFQADFYFKVDDDIVVNLEELASYLRLRRSHPNLYLGCMGSGPVLTKDGHKWSEPEAWRFGDAVSGRYINYPRYASGQIYGLSRPVALYLGQNQAVLHRYHNEDVSVGVWLLGLDVEYVNERRMCCHSLQECAEQTGPENVCLSYVETWCAGVCNSETRLEPIWSKCLKEPYSTAPLLKKAMELKRAKEKAEKEKMLTERVKVDRMEEEGEVTVDLQAEQ